MFHLWSLTMCLRGWNKKSSEQIKLRKGKREKKTSADSSFRLIFIASVDILIVVHLFIVVIFSKARDRAHFGHMVQQIVHIDDEYVMSLYTHFDTNAPCMSTHIGHSRWHTHNYQVNKLAAFRFHTRFVLWLLFSCGVPWWARSKLIFLIAGTEQII